MFDGGVTSSSKQRSSQSGFPFLTPTIGVGIAGAITVTVAVSLLLPVYWCWYLRSDTVTVPVSLLLLVLVSQAAAGEPPSNSVRVSLGRLPLGRQRGGWRALRLAQKPVRDPGGGGRLG